MWQRRGRDKPAITDFSGFRGGDRLFATSGTTLLDLMFRIEVPDMGGRSMKRLIKQFLDDGLSRRQLMTGLSALGLSSVAAKSMAQSLAPFGQAATPPVSAVREMRGTGGALFVQQLKAAGVEYIFFNPSTGDYPIFDALVDEPGIQLIKGIH
jgi:hypothetical protein